MMDGICSVCVGDMQSDHESGRRFVWDALPTYFGLGSWDEIRTGAQRWSDEQDSKEVEEC